MALSQNGFTGIASYDDARLTKNPLVPGSGGVKILGGLLAGAESIVLLYVAHRFDADVEKLTQQQGCWGFGPRDIRGSTTLSNHASGTAIDLNSTKHPLGASGTFTAQQVKSIRSILAFCGGTIRWGGDYTGRKDEMHFEIVGTHAAIASVANRILFSDVKRDVVTAPPDTKADDPDVAFTDKEAALLATLVHDVAEIKGRLLQGAVGGLDAIQRVLLALNDLQQADDVAQADLDDIQVKATEVATRVRGNDPVEDTLQRLAHDLIDVRADIEKKKA